MKLDREINGRDRILILLADGHANNKIPDVSSMFFMYRRLKAIKNEFRGEKISFNFICYHKCAVNLRIFFITQHYTLPCL